jgi:hypothetical protein
MPRNLSVSPAKALAESIDYRVKLYSAAAAAAGVSMLALAQPADAEVVVTKANLPFTYLQSVSLDLNQDGIADFRFSIHLYDDFSFSSRVGVIPLAGANVVASPGLRGPYASALVRGAKIGPSAHFSSSSRFDSGAVAVERIRGSSRGAIHLYGNWEGSLPNRFLGVKFLIDGATHYGWVRLTLMIHHSSPISGTITGYAYETVADKRILAGVTEKLANHEVETSQAPSLSLGMLALGANGLALWRRDETSER